MLDRTKLLTVNPAIFARRPLLLLYIARDGGGDSDSALPRSSADDTGRNGDPNNAFIASIARAAWYSLAPPPVLCNDYTREVAWQNDFLQDVYK